MKIDLSNILTNKDKKVYEGEEEGRKLREQLRLEEYEEDDTIEKIVIEVPDYIVAMTCSFLMGVTDNYRNDYKYKVIANSNILSNIRRAKLYTVD